MFRKIAKLSLDLWHCNIIIDNQYSLYYNVLQIYFSWKEGKNIFGGKKWKDIFWFDLYVLINVRYWWQSFCGISQFIAFNWLCSKFFKLISFSQCIQKCHSGKFQWTKFLSLLENHHKLPYFCSKIFFFFPIWILKVLNVELDNFFINNDY